MFFVVVVVVQVFEIAPLADFVHRFSEKQSHAVKVDYLTLFAVYKQSPTQPRVFCRLLF